VNTEILAKSFYPMLIWTILKRYTEDDVKNEIVLKKEGGGEEVIIMILYTIMKKSIPKSTKIQKSKNIVFCEIGNAYHKNSKDNIYYKKYIRYNLPFIPLLLFVPFFFHAVIAFSLSRILAYVCDIQGHFHSVPY